MAERSSTTPPTIQVSNVRDVLTAAGLGALTGGALQDFLRGRRWFGAKAGRILAVRIRDVVRLPWDGEGRYAVARLEVDIENRGTRVYQLPLALRAPEKTPSAIVARVRTPAGEALLFDATEDSTFLRRLAAELATGGAFGAHADDGTAARWIIAPEGAQGLVVPPDGELRVLAGEQSNTSVIFADAGVLKLFRALEPGAHPDVELTRYLTSDAWFGHTPTLLGTVHFEESDGTVTMAGMLQEYLAHATDAWVYAVECAHDFVYAAREDAPNTFAADAERLGAITRSMHDALAGAPGELAAIPASAADVQHWGDEAKDWIRRGMTSLSASHLMNSRAAAESEALGKREAAYVGLVDEVVNQVGDDAGLRMRIHGDYHLGQVLRVAGGDFMVIDFEGEPLRSLAERRDKTSALRDVAGMLRSLAYAALGGESRRGSSEGDVRMEIRAGRWERDVRAAFLRGYFSGNGEVASVAARPPRMHLAAGAGSHRLITLFEIQKAFYELVYELNNRPDWAWIPMRGIAKLLAA